MVKLHAVATLALTAALSGMVTGCNSESQVPISQTGQASAGSPKIEITSPTSGAEVPQKQQVTGTASGVPNDQELWIFTRKGKTLAPQSSVIQVRPDGSWSQTAYVGKGDGTDAGDKFEITIQLVRKSVSQPIADYLKDAAKTGKYPGLNPPEGSVEAAKIAVTKIAVTATPS